jgi:hypothetical protein
LKNMVYFLNAQNLNTHVHTVVYLDKVTLIKYAKTVIV